MNQNDRLDEPELNREPDGAPPPMGPIDSDTFEAMKQHARHRSFTTGWRITFLAVLGAILLVLSLVALSLYGASKDDQAKAADNTLGTLAAKVAQACKDNPAEARKTFGAVCGEAKGIDDRPPGQKGATGDRGPKGDQGNPGTPCVPANPACRGPRGPMGAQGKPGPTPACMLLPSKCVGATGKLGPAGPAGKDGKDGKDGPQGEQGVEGPIGQAGQTGPEGPQGPGGPAGPAGPQGPQGTPGEDVETKCTAAGGTFKIIKVSGDDPDTLAVEPMVTLSTCVL